MPHHVTRCHITHARARAQYCFKVEWPERNAPTAGSNIELGFEDLAVAREWHGRVASRIAELKATNHSRYEDGRSSFAPQLDPHDSLEPTPLCSPTAQLADGAANGGGASLLRGASGTGSGGVAAAAAAATASAAAAAALGATGVLGEGGGRVLGGLGDVSTRSTNNTGPSLMPLEAAVHSGVVTPYTDEQVRVHVVVGGGMGLRGGICWAQWCGAQARADALSA